MTKKLNTIRNHIIISSVIIILRIIIFNILKHSYIFELGMDTSIYYWLPIDFFMTDLILGNVFFFLIYRIIKNKNNKERKKIIKNHTIISLVIVSYFLFNIFFVYERMFIDYILTKLILGNIILLVITWIIKHIKNMKYEGKDIIHNMISDLSLNGIERFLKLTYYVFIFLIINTIIDFIKLINESGEYLTFKDYIYYIFGLFGLFSYLLLVNYVLRTRK